MMKLLLGIIKKTALHTFNEFLSIYRANYEFFWNRYLLLKLWKYPIQIYKNIMRNLVGD